jgi:hypothetical protein
MTGGPITSSGTLSVNVGTAAGQIVQVQAGGKLPVLDGSALTNLNGASIAASSNIAVQNVSANGGSFRSIVLNDTEATPKTATLQAPATITTPYSLTLPAALPASGGQMLVTDTSGNLSWVVPAHSHLYSSECRTGRKNHFDVRIHR